MTPACACEPRGSALSRNCKRFATISGRRSANCYHPASRPNGKKLTKSGSASAKARRAAICPRLSSPPLRDRLFLLGFGGLADLLILLLETVYAAFGVDQLLFAGEKRVATGANF